MKNRKSICIKILAVALIVAMFASFTALLVACDDVSHEAQNPDSESFQYKQAEHIGWAASIKNFQNSAFSEYYNGGEPAFVVPGLNKGQNFVLQGIAYLSEMNWTLLCGYVNPSTEKSNSVIFVMDMNMSATSTSGHEYHGVLIKELFLKKADGTVYTGHAGGLTVTKKNVWIANGGKLYRISLDDIKNAPKSSDIRFADSINVPVLSSYCSYADGILWVGEFEYERDDYKTTHVKDGALRAWTVGYVLNEDGDEAYDEKTGFKLTESGAAIPDYVLWHGEKVQGMAEVGGKIVLSTSYGRKNNSNLYIFGNPVRGENAAEPDGMVEIAISEVGPINVPYYALTTAEKTVTAPPMTEDLSVMRDGDGYKVLVASESGSYFYHGYQSLNTSKYATDFVWLYTVEQ